MAKKRDFCDPSDYSVLIPYRDFEKLVQMADKYDHIEKLYQQQEDRYVAIQQMFREALDKIRELEHMI